MTLPICSMKKEVRQAMRHGAALAGSLRRLQLKLAICQGCGLRPHCPRRTLYRQQVEAALMQISLEWDLEEG